MDSVEKIHHADNTQEWRRYIHDSVMITQVLNTSGSVTATRTQFLLKDHLGSVNVITDGAGKITDLLAFDPWGKRRAESNWTSLSVSATQSTWFVGAKPKTSRGFTGHQMADEMEIIHMGGRIYDPLLGRFLQADPFVQSPSTTASLNRYSYVWNNPLNATDPSGFSLSSLWKEVRPFVGAIVGVVLAVTVPWAAEAWGPVVIGMIAGAAGAAANGTSIFKGAMFGAFSGMAYMAGGVLGSAIWGGMEANMNGGAFGRGFVAAGIGAMGGAGGGGPSIKGFVTSAVLGGVATEVTGGKFKNGAASAAFMYAVSVGVRSFNHSGQSDNGAPQGKADFSKEEIADIDARIAEAKKRLEGRTGASPNSTNPTHDSAVMLTNDEGLMSVSSDYKIEVAANIDQDGAIRDIRTSYHHSKVANTATGSQAVWHTHPSAPMQKQFGIETNMRSLSASDIAGNRSWTYAAYFDRSIIAMRAGNSTEYIYQNGSWGKTGLKKSF